jgi:glycosyltransferase involved in cell wall biosynthesis
MNQTKVLVVGMVDSIHLARWLSQFSELPLTFVVFPSNKFRKIHLNLIKLTKSSSMASYEIVTISKLNYLNGYLDFFVSQILSNLFSSLDRKSRLKKLIDGNKFDYIHAIEIQSAGYLVDSLPLSAIQHSKFILTNWGSDIYFYQKFPQHLIKIKSLLAKANFYSAECQRDYDLANRYGFVGKNLPCIPNAGGFDLSDVSTALTATSTRNQIIIKGYGNFVGRADIPVRLIEKLSSEFTNLKFLIYSATDNIVHLVNKLPKQVRLKIRIIKMTRNVSQEEIMTEFSKSRVYIGSSESDGASTSFLQALVTGAYPIQTNSSCANEWVSRGAKATIVSLDPSELYQAINAAINDDALVNSAMKANLQVADLHLNKEVIKKEALKFYSC